VHVGVALAQLLTKAVKVGQTKEAADDNEDAAAAKKEDGVVDLKEDLFNPRR
jgi:hypothetical protein